MIYLLEDDESIRKLVVYALKSQDMEAEGFERPSALFAALAEQVPEMILLDLMLPEQDGLSVLAKLREDSRTEDIPVIILTAKATEYDRVEGLEAGADDYIVKPFGMMELIARVRAVLRRTEKQRGGTVYKVGEITLIPDQREVTADGQSVVLTHKEFDILMLLMSRPGRVLERATLLDRVWDLGSEPENRTLDVHIRTLRAKLGEAGNRIKTVRGVGYMIQDEP